MMSNELQIETSMSGLPVTAQLTYGDLKLLEEAKVYGIKTPYRLTFDAVPPYALPYYKDSILAELRMEREVISAELWEEHDQLNAVLPFIDRLISRIEQLP